MSSVHPGPNTRRRLDSGSLKELTESILAHGVLQPILVRPDGDGGFEIVAGERRWRAAQAAGLPQIPAIVRHLDDQAALEAGVIENLQREDVHPLEEAEGYQRLQERGLTVEEIAARVGKSRSYVRGRMRLGDLPPRAKQLFQAGKLDAARAAIVGRIHNPGLAERAASEIAAGGLRLTTVAEAEEHVRRNYMLRLAGAPFSTSSADLTKAGACTTCPKRSGAQSDLFGGAAGKEDLCLDPTCFRAKTDAATARKLEAAKEKSTPILPKGEAKKLFYGDRMGYCTRWVETDEKDWEYGHRGKTLKQALGEKAPPVHLAVNPHTGMVHELYRREDVQKASGAARGKAARKKNPGEMKRQREQDIRARVERSLREQLVTAAELREPPGFWQAMAAGAIARGWHDTLKEVTRRRGLDAPGKSGGNPKVRRPPRKSPSDVLMSALAGMAPGPLRGLAVEIILGPFVADTLGDFARRGPTAGKYAREAFGLGLEAARKRAQEELAAKTKRPHTGEKKTSSRKKKARNSAPRRKEPSDA